MALIWWGPTRTTYSCRKKYSDFPFSHFLGRRSVASRRPHRTDITTGSSWPAVELRFERPRADPHKHRPDVDRACQIRQASTKLIDAAHSGVAPRPLRDILRATDRSEKNKKTQFGFNHRSYASSHAPPACPRNSKIINRVAHQIMARSKCLGREVAGRTPPLPSVSIAALSGPGSVSAPRHPESTCSTSSSPHRHLAPESSLLVEKKLWASHSWTSDP